MIDSYCFTKAVHPHSVSKKDTKETRLLNARQRCAYYSICKEAKYRKVCLGEK